MAIALSVITALVYGVSDYVGGRTSRRASPVTISLIAEVTMLAIMLVVVPVVETKAPTDAAMGWGIVAGAVSGAAIVGFYVALARGNMTVVAPVTGIVAAVVPVVVGLADGERPGITAGFGIAAAVLAVGIIGGGVDAVIGPRAATVSRSTLGLAVVVGLGFGLLFVAFARTGDSGTWPLLLSRVGGIPLLSVAFIVQQRSVRRDILNRGAVSAGVAIGVLIVVANGTYLAATREGLLSIVAVVASMYPASTMCLAAALDRERPTRSQMAGMALGAASLIAITLGSG